MSRKAEQNKWSRRDKKRSRRKAGHRTDGRSVFIIQQVQIRKAQRMRQEEQGA